MERFASNLYAGMYHLGVVLRNKAEIIPFAFRGDVITRSATGIFLNFALENNKAVDQNIAEDCAKRHIFSSEVFVLYNRDAPMH